MRFKLVLRRVNGDIIPINYQYPLSSISYKILNRADASLSDWLHNKGFQLENKQYKLFTFSPIDPLRYQVERGTDRMKILSDTVFWRISFYLNHPATESFVKGLFQNQRFELGDHKSRVVFEVQSVELEPIPAFNSTMKFKALSPVCISVSNERGMPQYLSPTDSGYEDLFFDNLLRRYRAICAFENKPELSFAQALDFKVLSEPKSRLITIKSNTTQETRVRGYVFDFEINAPKELVEVCYFAGVGEKNSGGFGYVVPLQAKIPA